MLCFLKAAAGLERLEAWRCTEGPEEGEVGCSPQGPRLRWAGGCCDGLAGRWASFPADIKDRVIARERSETGSFAVMRMDLASVIQSEGSQKEKSKYCILSYIYMYIYGI